LTGPAAPDATVLRVRKLQRGIEITASRPHPSVESWQQWRAIVVAVLRVAFANRPAAFFEPEYRIGGRAGRSLVAEISGEHPMLLRRNRGMRVTWVRQCSESLLDELATSGEFDDQSVWVGGLPPGDMESAEAVATAVAHATRAGFASPPETTTELFIVVFDGDAVWWLNPTVPMATISAKLESAARARGWTIDFSWVDPA
jgi:hypothetical protein